MTEICGLKCRKLQSNIYEVVEPYKPDDLNQWLVSWLDQITLVIDGKITLICKDMSAASTEYIYHYIGTRNPDPARYRIHYGLSSRECNMIGGLHIVD